MYRTVKSTDQVLNAYIISSSDCIALLPARNEEIEFDMVCALRRLPSSTPLR